MKKQMILKFLTVALLTSTVLFACKKDDTFVPMPEAVKKLMFDWKITNITTSKKNEPNTDSALFKNCMNDDLVRFNTAGFDFRDGASKCDSAVFNYAKGSWAYNTVTDSILLGATSPAKYMSWKVIKINDSVLQV